MKIRIKGNSLRYRLTRSEVEKLAKEGVIEDNTEFATGTLVYSLRSIAAGHLSASFEDNCITLYMPGQFLQEWTDTDRVGFEHTDNGIYLLIEKDFVCLDNQTEDQSDNYPNPLADKLC